MNFARNPAFWVLASAVTLFWSSDYALGTALNRDVIDLVAMAFSFVMGCRLAADAIDRFWRGGGQKNWQLLMGNFLLSWGWFTYSGWTFLARALDRPIWMIESPMNGFFKFVLLGGFVMTFFGTNETPEPLPASKLYYVALGIAFGGIGGVILARFLPI